MFKIKNMYLNSMDEGGAPEAAPEQEQAAPLLGESDPELGEGEYFIMDGIKGQGEQPDWFKSSKYKSIADQAKAYTELEKKFGAFTGAPDEYTLPDGIGADREDIAHLQEKAKEMGMSQDGFEELAVFVYELTNIKEEVSQEVELAALGEDAGDRIKTVETFLKNKLDPDTYAEVHSQVTTAKDVMLLESVIKATQPVKLPIDGGVVPGAPTWDDIEREMYRKSESGQLLRSIDSRHEQKIQKMLKEYGG